MLLVVAPYLQRNSLLRSHLPWPDERHRHRRQHVPPVRFASQLQADASGAISVAHAQRRLLHINFLLSASFQNGIHQQRSRTGDQLPALREPEPFTNGQRCSSRFVTWWALDPICVVQFPRFSVLFDSYSPSALFLSRMFPLLLLFKKVKNQNKNTNKQTKPKQKHPKGKIKETIFFRIFLTKKKSQNKTQIRTILTVTSHVLTLKRNKQQKSTFD